MDNDTKELRALDITWSLALNVFDELETIDAESLPFFSHFEEAPDVEQALRESAVILGAMAKVVANPTRSNYQKFLALMAYRRDHVEALLRNYENRCAARDAITPMPTESEVDMVVARNRQVVMAAYIHERCNVGVACIAAVMACSRSTVYARLEQFAKWRPALKKASLERIHLDAILLAVGQ